MNQRNTKRSGARIDSFRGFWAVDIPSAIRLKIGDYTRILASAGADINWVGPRRMHFTLSFLGSAAKSSIQDIVYAADMIALRHARFSIRLASTGFFPNITKPRIIWIGIDRGTDELSRLAVDVIDAMDSLGFRSEKRMFTPHLTIGRVRRGSVSEVIRRIEKTDLPHTLTMDVSSIILYKSNLTPSGPDYEVIRKVPLAGKTEGTCPK